jgi:biopolymer transport protein ExbD
MRRLRRKKGPQELDISPLIDVVFILLIFFMVSTTFVKDVKLELERPAASSGSRASTKSVRLYIDRNADVFLGEAPVKPWMIQSRVRELLRNQSEASVLLVVDRTVPAEKLIEVVDQCRLAGAADVGVITRSEEGA